MLSRKRLSLIRNSISRNIRGTLKMHNILLNPRTLIRSEPSLIRKRRFFTTNPRTYSQNNADNNTHFFDPYKILGLESEASLKQVKEAYIRLSRIHHPDFNTGDKKSEEKFILITEAYRKITETLAAKYDDSHDKDGPNEKKLYDFTITPLGVETEPMEERKFINWMKLSLFTLAILCSYYIKTNYLSDVKYFAQSYFWPEPSEYEYMRATKEKIRIAMLKEANKQQEKDRLLNSAREAMYGARK